MKLLSRAFEHGAKIPDRHTCKGENISPAFFIEDIHEAAETLAFIVDDPDAPMGTWVHWVMWNIKPEDELKLKEGTLPEEAVQGRNSAGKLGYHGPCPPSGTHRYYFKLYALDKKLKLKEGATKEDLLAAMEGHILERATLVGLYSK
jgi:Raf kinase inhibitor-like YbhB/YbcL family protein